MTREQILEQALRRVIQVRDERDKVLMVAELALAASGSEPPVDEFNRALNIPASQSSIQQGAMPPDAPTPSVTELSAESDLLAKLVSIRDHFGARSSVDAREIYDALDSLIRGGCAEMSGDMPAPSRPPSVTELRALLKRCRNIVDYYAMDHPKWIYDGREQDPSGVHALRAELESALSAAPEESCPPPADSA